jgi:hypothetical protein
MSPHSFIPSKKWPEAVSEALSYITELPEHGDIDEPVFLFGPPFHGRLPLRVRVKGHTTPLCVLGDEYPFLDELRDWMERCLTYDRLGIFHPEIATLDTPDGVCYLLMVHAGWERPRQFDVSSISELIVILSDCNKPAFRCFCRTRETIRDLYGAILECIHEYRSLFDGSMHWYDTDSFSLLDKESCSARMEKLIRSRAIEIKTGFHGKNHH